MSRDLSRASVGTGSDMDRAVAAMNRGDRLSASALAGQVLTVDGGNADPNLAIPGN
jgi:hypothetical protein